MAGRIPQHFIDELIARTDIVEVIGSRVQLKKAGREWKACCPFHSEKTPSFWVQPDKQFYHCFGCGAHGTALGFLMEHDGLSFVDAVEDLAQRAGLDVPREGGDTSPADRAQDDLYALLANVAQFYRDVLKETEHAKDYLKRRGLAGDTAMRFGIGYAPDSWDAVLKKFGATEVGKRALLAAGLIIERTADTSKSHGPGHYDRFRDRIMFPIRDTRGRVIAFGGRIIDKGEPKYLNSPETTLFHKGRELYGLYEARQALRQMPRLLVVEGYMDVVRLSQAGIHYAVATLGTATTPEHLNRIFRVCTEVVFSFDGDRAGRQAAWRALENALPQAKEGRQLKFLFLPDGHDPDTLVGEEGKEAFEARLGGALPLSEYFVQALKAQVEVESVDGRARLAELAKPLIARLPAGVYRELLIDRLAQEVRMPAPRLAQLLGVAADNDGPGSQGAGGSARTPQRGPVRAAVSAGRGNLVRQAITLILHHPAAARGTPDVEELALVDRPGLALLAELLATLREDPQLSTAQLLERWRDRPDGAHLAKLAAGESLVADATAAARDLMEALTKLLAEFGPGQRVDTLLGKAADQGLTSEEKIELQGLLATRGGKR